MAEIYDPATGAFSNAGSVGTARYSHTVTTLPDGTIMILGGSDSADLSNKTAEAHPLASAEFYDPTTAAFRSALPMAAPRIGPTATLLDSGKLLVIGGKRLRPESGRGPGRDVLALIALPVTYAG